MAESAAHLVDKVFPRKPLRQSDFYSHLQGPYRKTIFLRFEYILKVPLFLDLSLFVGKSQLRQWVISFPFQLWFLFAKDPKIMGEVLKLVFSPSLPLSLDDLSAAINYMGLVWMDF